VNRIAAIFRWELLLALRNRFMLAFAIASILGGVTLLAAAPAPETLAMAAIQVILFFGSLLAFLVGWSSGQQARAEGAFLFAQPIGAGELVVGKVLGAGSWCLALLLLFLAPAAIQAGMTDTLLTLILLASGYALVCLSAGLLIGLSAAPVPGLLAVLMSWVILVAGWELGLLVLAEIGGIASLPALFVTLLLVNPAGVFRIGALVGLETIPFDTAELETGRLAFDYIWTTAGTVFIGWILAILTLTIWRVGRAEF